jgi:hypothetical protein
MEKIKSIPHNDGNKTLVQLELVGRDGNAFSLMGAFQREGKRQGFNEEWIEEVLAECQTGQYHHLLATLLENTTTEGMNNGKPDLSSLESPKTDVLVDDVCPDDYRPAYWDGEGKYQALKDKYWDSLIPSNGECLDSDKNIIVHAECLRMINRLGYDLYNNGLCNDRSDEVNFLMRHEHLFAPFCEHKLEMENFNQFCHYYLEQLEMEDEHESYTMQDCGVCYGHDDECMECDGSGEVEMYHDYEGVDWLDWFDGNRMRMYDRIMDAIIMYVDSVETSKDNG